MAYDMETLIYILRSNKYLRFLCKCGRNYCGLTEEEKNEQYNEYCKIYELDRPNFMLTREEVPNDDGTLRDGCEYIDECSEYCGGMLEDNHSYSMDGE